MLSTLLDSADATGKKTGKTSCLWRTSVVVVGDRYVDHRDTVCQVVTNAMEKSGARKGAGVCHMVMGVPVTLWRARDWCLAATEGCGAKKRKKMSPGGLKAGRGGETVGSGGLEK